jgi:N-acetylmuramoyl-L-alanine amidase
MLVDMNQQSVLQRSEALASEILGSFRGSDLPPRRKVKQRSFQVLRTISMPSVLVEAGFITNSRDARIAASAEGRQRIAAAIARGIISYLRKNPPQRRTGDPVVVHKVRRGDTLWKISRTYHTSISDLRKVNKLGKKSVLRVGQELVVSRGF